MTTPAMVAIKSISKIIYQTCGPNIPITLHPKIPHPSLPLKKKIKKKDFLRMFNLIFFNKLINSSQPFS
jgi:hypothetical protein